MNFYALDAPALLALLREEPGAARVREVIGNALVSSVNWAEVLQKARQWKVETAGLAESLKGLGMRIEAFDEAQADIAAELWTKTQSLGLSLGDSACLALGLRHNCPIVTADKSWLKLRGCGVIETIR